MLFTTVRILRCRFQYFTYDPIIISRLCSNKNSDIPVTVFINKSTERVVVIISFMVSVTSTDVQISKSINFVCINENLQKLLATLCLSQLNLQKRLWWLRISTLYLYEDWSEKRLYVQLCKRNTPYVKNTYGILKRYAHTIFEHNYWVD